MRKIHIYFLLCGITAALAGGAYYGYLKRQTPKTSTPAPNSQQQTNVTTSQPNQSQKNFDKNQLSTTDPTSIWFIANKLHSMPVSYIPSDLIVPTVPLRLAASEEQMQLRKVAQDDLEKLFSDAKQVGIQLQFGSGYRSASYQQKLYSGYVQSIGKAEADRSSARPGHSEHQTGLALDFTRPDGICHLEACFGDLPEGKWLAENAYKYGYILRYTPDKETVTGYMYEPWHFRYVGNSLAHEMHTTNIATLEEFFGQSAAPNYAD